MADAPVIGTFPRRQTAIILIVLAALAILSYLPTFMQPLMEDDYPQIALALHYGDDAGWSKMLATPEYRVRATLSWLAYTIYGAFEMHAPAYYAATILMHVLNTWIIFAMGAWRAVGYRVAACAAAFFAVYEGHQEAIMWFSGSTEALQFLFGGIAFVCWLRILDGRMWWFAPALISFTLALLSKESAVVFVALFALPILFDKTLWRKIWLLIPFAILAAASALSILATQVYSYRFRDGGFSFHAPFWIIWPDSFAHLFWFWGALAFIAILIWRPAHYKQVLAIAILWAGLSLIPYSFLTYQLRVPSRHTYLPSAGIAILVGFAWTILYHRRRSIAIMIAAAIVIHNVAYLWTRKRDQYLERAAPTEQLIALARSTKSPIYMRCWPKARETAETAIQLTLDRPADNLIWDEPEAHARQAVPFCYPKR